MVKKDKLPEVQVVYDFRGETRDRKSGKIKDDALGTVSVRVYQDRGYKVISTGVRVKASEWSDEYYVIRRDDAAVLNSKIRAQVQKCKQLIAEAIEERNTVPGTAILRIDEKRDSWLVWLGKQIKINTNIGDKTRQHHTTMYNSLLSYAKMRKFEDVRHDNICEWLSMVRNRTVNKMVDGEVVAVKVSKSAVHNYWKRFGVYVKLAIDAGLLPRDVLKGIKVPRGEAAEREHLTDEEIKRWIETPMPSPYLADTRDRFIVQMGTGLAYSDLMSKDFTKREEMNGYMVLDGRRCKTVVDYFVVILPFAVKVLEKWDWKVAHISDVKYNKYLKMVALRCGIDKKITSHVARHTYACYLLRHKVPMAAIQRTLGHKRITTTQIYAKMLGEDVLTAFAEADIK